MLRKFYSKPDYQALTQVPGRRHHFLITDDEGKKRAKELLADITGISQCVFVSDSQSLLFINDAEKFSLDTLMEYLTTQFATLPAGTQFYLLGREQFIWSVHSMLRQLYVSESLCAVERCGPIERDVFCVHCRQIISGVRHNPVECSGCGCLLFIYDHFSKRLGSYMGFKVNAESEDEIPALEELDS